MSKASNLLERLGPLWEMADLDSRDTGIHGIVIYVSPSQHSSGPRIKVGKNNGTMRSHKYSFSMTISDNPEIIAGSPEGIANSKKIELVKIWIKKNKDILLKYWNKEVFTRDLFNEIKPIND